MLINNFDENNRMHLKEMRGKEFALEKYPPKPLHKDRNRIDNKKFYQELLADFDEIERSKEEEKKVKMKNDDDNQWIKKEEIMKWIN